MFYRSSNIITKRITTLITLKNNPIAKNDLLRLRNTTKNINNSYYQGGWTRLSNDYHMSILNLFSTTTTSTPPPTNPSIITPSTPTNTTLPPQEQSSSNNHHQQQESSSSSSKSDYGKYVFSAIVS